MMKKIVMISGLSLLLLLGASLQAQAMGLNGSDVPFQNLRTQVLRPSSVWNRNAQILQEKLKELGIYTMKVDGKYGPGTIRAVKKFQEMKGLKRDGIAGPMTLRALLASLNTTGSMSGTGGIKPPHNTGDDSACTMIYKPVCGEIKVHAMGGKEWKEQKTFSNTCEAKKAHAKILYEGKCKTTRPVDSTISTSRCNAQVIYPHPYEKFNLENNQYGNGSIKVDVFLEVVGSGCWKTVGSFLPQAANSSGAGYGGTVSSHGGSSGSTLPIIGNLNFANPSHGARIYHQIKIFDAAYSGIQNLTIKDMDNTDSITIPIELDF